MSLSGGLWLIPGNALSQLWKAKTVLGSGGHASLLTSKGRAHQLGWYSAYPRWVLLRSGKNTGLELVRCVRALGPVSPSWCWMMLLPGVDVGPEPASYILGLHSGSIAFGLGQGSLVHKVSPCDSLAWGFCSCTSLMIHLYAGQIAAPMPCICQSWGTAAFQGRVNLFLGTVCCRLSTVLITLITVHLQLTNSLTYTHWKCVQTPTHKQLKLLIVMQTQVSIKVNHTSSIPSWDLFEKQNFPGICSKPSLYGIPELKPQEEK